MNRDMEIGLMGASLGTGNRGVSALSASVIKLFRTADPDARVFLLIGNKNNDPFRIRIKGKPVEVPVVNYRQSPRAKPSQFLGLVFLSALVYRILPLKWLRRKISAAIPWIGSLSRAHIVADIRGGDSFSDIYGLKRFLMGSMPALLSILVRGEVLFLPQTYGPFKSRAARMVARFILMRTSAIYARDRASMAAVTELTRGKRQARLCPDVAFGLEAITPPNPVIEPPLPVPREEPVIGINVNGLMYHGGYTRNNMFGLKLDYPRFLVDLVVSLQREFKARILLVPHTFAPRESVESDPGACIDLKTKLPPECRDRVHHVAAEYDQNEIKGIIGMCDFFIGSRMHSCIAALSQGIPTVGVAYSRKFAGVFESVGMQEWVIDGVACTSDEAIGKILDCCRNRALVSGKLGGSAEMARARLQDIFGGMMGGRDAGLRVSSASQSAESACAREV